MEPARRKKFVPEKKREQCVESRPEAGAAEEVLLEDTTVCEDYDSTHIHHLPEEVMLHILSWLPIQKAVQAARGKNCGIVQAMWQLHLHACQSTSYIHVTGG